MGKKLRTKPLANGRAATNQFLKLTRSVYNSDNFKKLSAKAIKLLIDIAIQYNGYNNGDLQASFEPMKKRGWNSSATLNVAKRELEYYGFIELTRQGCLGRCSLYAVAWESIDECKGKIDCKPTKTPSMGFLESRKLFRFQNKAKKRIRKNVVR